MSEKHNTDSIRISQILAGALAAVTAALLGSTMGVAGTVAGAGLASVVTTVGGALYLRSIQRTREGVRTVREKVSARTLVVKEEAASRGGPPISSLPTRTDNSVVHAKAKRTRRTRRRRHVGG